MYTFDQQSGLFTPSDKSFSAVAYSGFGIHRNNPDSEGLTDLGPIPRGLWVIGFPLTHIILGPFVLPLYPRSPFSTYSRRDFFIHGDSSMSPGNSSKGCIVLELCFRKIIIDSNDHLLKVR